MVKNKHPFIKILKEVSEIWNIAFLVINVIYVVRFDFPLILLVLFISVIYIPLLIAIVVYIWRHPPEAKAKILKINMQLSRILLSAILFYVFYGVVNLIFYTEVKIESAKIISKISFIKMSSFLPLLPHKHEHTFRLEKEQDLTTELNRTIYIHKQFDNDQPILVPWGNYEVRYIYAAETTTDTMKFAWNFRSFRRHLRLP